MPISDLHRETEGVIDPMPRSSAIQADIDRIAGKRYNDDQRGDEQMAVAPVFLAAGQQALAFHRQSSTMYAFEHGKIALPSAWRTP